PAAAERWTLSGLQRRLRPLAHQDTGQGIGDIAEEQGAGGAAILLRVTAAQGQHAEQSLMLYGGHGAGGYLAALVAEQERQLMLAQHPAQGQIGRASCRDRVDVQ